jgi:hypothetical protein
LQKALRKEKSALAKVGVFEGLYLLGDSERISDIVHLMKNKRYVVRCAAANTLLALADRKNKKIIKETLTDALKNESTVAVKSTIENALKKLGRIKSTGKDGVKNLSKE